VFFDVQVLQESLSIPGTDIYLVYRSSQTSGYMSTIVIQLTPDDISEALVAVHLRIIVEGVVFERLFEADPNLRYRFTWDRRNAYNQKVYGIVTASGETAASFVLSNACNVVSDYESLSLSASSMLFLPAHLCLSWSLFNGTCFMFSAGLRSCKGRKSFVIPLNLAQAVFRTGWMPT